jgi:uncharacterized membrane protein YdbT with pleckstrin-like domain
MESAMSIERTVWSGTPSQVINLSSFIYSGLFFWLIFPLFSAFWKWLEVKNTKYEITTQRLKTESGIFNKKLNDLELYRVQDYSVDEPFFLRLFGLCNITLETSDFTDPRITLLAISKNEQLNEKIRTYVEEAKAEKRLSMVNIQ